MQVTEFFFQYISKHRFLEKIEKKILFSQLYLILHSLDTITYSIHLTFFSKDEIQNYIGACYKYRSNL